MTGAIPPYPGFRRESLPYSGGLLASRRYVFKANPNYWIRSSNNSEHWFLFYNDAVFAELDTFTAAQVVMRRVAVSPPTHYPTEAQMAKAAAMFDDLRKNW